MVKLRVAARIVSEDNYLASAGKPSAATVTGEKRLVVIVRDPYKWQIGTLALEVQRAYRSCYQHDLPTIKYLKDNEDDCDLDPELYVSDLLLDEGRAQRDGSDQRVTIKVILEQGRALREGSVAVGSQLDRAQYVDQLHMTARPPVPTFPGLPSALGKRDSSSAALTQVEMANGHKRARQFGIPESIEEECMISSIERDEPNGVHPSGDEIQVPSSHPEQSWQRKSPDPKAESSPELWRSVPNPPQTTSDELEELPGQPTAWSSQRGDERTSTDADNRRGSGALNGLLASSGRSLPQVHDRSRAPITPPSETSKRRSGSATLQLRSTQDATKTPAHQPTTASASKFKRRDIYDYVDSDIDDSQMSPRSRQAQLGPQTTANSMSRIEGLPSSLEDDNAEQRLSVSQAIDALENESVFEETRPFPDYSNEGDKENRPSHTPTVLRNLEVVKANSQGPATQPHIPDIPLPEPAQKSDAPDSQTSQTPKKRNRKKLRKSDVDSVSGDQPPNPPAPASTLQNPKTPSAKKPIAAASKSARKNKVRPRTPSLDSPGEQLSQSLQESARRQLSMSALDKKLTAQQTASLNKPEENKKEPKPFGKPKSSAKNGEAEQINSRSSLTVKHSQEGHRQHSAMAQPLPDWGTAEPVAKNAPQLPANTKAASLNLNVPDLSAARKSPSIGLGLTEQEIKVMESRAAMTQEQYAEQKKKRQQEAKKLAEELKKHGSGTKKKKVADHVPAKETPKLKRTPSAQPVVVIDSSLNATSSSSSDASTTPTAEVETSSQTKSGAEGNKIKQSSKTPATKKPEPAHKASSTTSSKSQIPQSTALSKIPSSKSAKSPSVVSSVAKKPEKTVVRSEGATKTPGLASKKSTPTSSSKVAKISATTPAPGSQINSKVSSKTAVPSSTPLKAPQTAAAPTFSTAKRLTDLRAVMRTVADKTATPAATKSLSRPGLVAASQRSSVFNSSSDDDDDESSDSDSDEVPPAKLKRIVKAKTAEADDDDDDDDDESNATSSKVAAKGTKSPATTTSGPKGKSLGRPDPSIRDRSVDSDEEEDSSEDDDEL